MKIDYAGELCRCRRCGRAGEVFSHKERFFVACSNGRCPGCYDEVEGGSLEAAVTNWNEREGRAHGE